MDLFSDLHKALISNLKKAGFGEHCTHYLFNSAISSKSVVIDLGANEGCFYSTLNAEYNCRCYAVEPSPRLFNRLPKNNNSSVFNFAICKTDGPVFFFLSDNSEANSLDQAIASQWGFREKTTVEGITFENFLEKINVGSVEVLKVDIEGAELDMLESITASRLNSISQITIEFHDFLYTGGEYLTRMRAVLKKLEDNNFLIIKISNPDWRSVLLLNKKLHRFSFSQKLRVHLLHRLYHQLITAHIFAGHLLGRNKK